MERRKNLNAKFGFVEIMEYTSIGESCSVVSGGTPSRSKNEYWENGNIPWIKIGNIKSKYVNEYDELITEQGLNNSSAKLLKKGTILYTIFATLGEVGILDIEACTNQAIAGINITDSRITSDYLYYYLKSKKDYVNNIGRGVAQNNINLTTLKNFEIPLIDVDKQLNIVEILEKVERMICSKEKEIDDLDLLIKARFVEMFGEINNIKHSYTSMNMPDICQIIDGDRGKNYPTAKEFFREGFCLFLNAKNVTSNGFNFNDCQFISREKDRVLRNGKLSIGDIVLTTRGTLGNLAFYNETIPYENVRINSGMVILRINKDLLNEIYFIEQFKMQLNIIKNKIANGSAQPQLPISLMNRIKITVPPLEMQNQFADFVKQVDKSREEVKKSLEKTQQLYDSLMQEYFG